MGISERKIRQKETVRDAIMAATQEIVSAEGWQALSIRKVAEAIEYSTPVIYAHFENKDAIRHMFIREGFSMLSEEIAKALDCTGSPEERLHEMALQYRRFALSKSCCYNILFDAGIPNCETLLQSAEMKRFSEHMRVAIQAVAGSDATPEKIQLKLHTFWSILHGLCSINLLMKDTMPDNLKDPVFEDAITGFIYYLKK